MNVTDQYQVQTEMEAEKVFIQYLEELRSGPVDSEDGINRPLVQLSRNSDALLEVLQATRSQVLSGGGVISWVGGTLVWSAAWTFRFANDLSGGVNNVLNAGNIALAAGQVAYVIFDRETSAYVLTVSMAANFAAFRAVIHANVDRLDIQFLAYRDGTSILLWDGRRIRDGYALANQGCTDTQYGQQTELTLVHDNEKENFKVVLTGGGTIFWDATAVSSTIGTFSWTEPFIVKLPATGGEIEITDGAGAPFSKSLEDGEVLWITLARGSAISTSVAVNRSAPGVGPLAGDDVFILAVREGSRVYIWNGTALSDGDSVLLGGVRSGVQWFYTEAGGADQVTAFGVTNTYRTGVGELMIFRNGVKARGSVDAHWSGVFPAGVLVGAINVDDQYVEEDLVGDGKGSRILWIADGGPGSLKHAANAHAPGDPFTWPDADDWIEAFIGVQGEGPSPVESIGIKDDPADPLQGSVQMEGTGGVHLEYDYPNNTIVFSLDAMAGVSGLTVDGSATGQMGGGITLKSGRLIEISDDGNAVSGEITVDLAVSDDQADAILGMLGDMDGVEPTAANPLVARQWVLDGLPPVVGFDLVYTADQDTIYIGPGRLRLGNVVLIQTERIEVTSSDILSADTLSPGDWHYLYVGVARNGSEQVGGYLSTTAPGTDGRHPDSDTIAEGELWFVSSVHRTTNLHFRQFTKRAGFVKLADYLSIVASGAMTASTTAQTIDCSSSVPDTGVTSVQIHCRFTQTNPAGSTAFITWGLTDSDYNWHVPAVDGAVASFEFETLLTPDKSFSFTMPTSWDSESEFVLSGYSEGTYSVGSGLWS